MLEFQLLGFSFFCISWVEFKRYLKLNIFFMLYFLKIIAREIKNRNLVTFHLNLSWYFSYAHFFFFWHFLGVFSRLYIFISVLLLQVLIFFLPFIFQEIMYYIIVFNCCNETLFFSYNFNFLYFIFFILPFKMFTFILTFFILFNPLVFLVPLPSLFHSICLVFCVFHVQFSLYYFTLDNPRQTIFWL